MRIFLILILQFLYLHLQAQLFPLSVSTNKRYFVDQSGKPFLYQADTGWQLFVKLTLEEAREYLLTRKWQGFNTIQVQVVMSPGQINRYGNAPFGGEEDFSKPNEAYHDHIKKVIAIADSLHLLMVMSQPWLGCCMEGYGNSPDKPIQKNGPVKNRWYGNYLGRKFASCKNLFWIGGGDNDPKGDRQSIVAFLEGLRETAPAFQLITYHASPPHSSTDLFQYAPWLGFSFIYTYWREKPTDWTSPDLQPHVYEAALREWSKSDVMPFVLGESQYEGDGTKSNDMGNPQIVRRQAYWTMLSGGAGHAYGADHWDFPTHWRNILQYPGAGQLKHLRTIFETMPWWTFIPDVKHQWVVNGYGDWSKNNYVTSAHSADSSWLVSYLPEIQQLHIDCTKLKGQKITAKWYNPSTGKSEKEINITEKTVQRFGPPYGADWLLVIHSEK
jgi:hypothetical protein